MATEIIMPKAGIDMTEGQIIKWNKKEGDKVETGEILLEIMTDKTSMELEAEDSGYLIKIIKGDGETVPVTEVIGYIGAEGEVAPEGISKDAVETSENVSDKKEKEPIKERGIEERNTAVKSEKGEDEFDVVVIGGGPAGYVAAIRAAQVGGKVAVVEKSELGGTCLNRGCIPTKTFLKNAEIIEGIEMSSKRGIILENEKFTVDMPKVVSLKNEIVKTLTNGVQGLLKSNSIKIFKGVGKINKDKDVVINGEKVLRTNKIILAGGSKVGSVNIPGIESKRVLTSSKIKEIIDEGDKLRIKLEDKEDVVAEKALLSIGRVPDLEAVGELDLEMERGKIKVDKYMETSVEGVYAPGDINGIKMLAHAAFRMGEVAAENAILGNHREIKLETTPSAIYTIPEVGMVGLTEEEAKEKYDINIGKFAFVGNGRALASGDTTGFVKVIADKKYGEILGVHIVGQSAAEIINEASSLMAMEITVDEVIKTIHGHPTFSEALFEACADVLGEAIHLPKKK